MQQHKLAKQKQKAKNEACGFKGDVDMQIMIAKARTRVSAPKPHTESSSLKLCVCVRKRPIFSKEEQRGEIDSCSAANPKIVIHEPKIKVDGITKYVDNQEFLFDNTFD